MLIMLKIVNVYMMHLLTFLVGQFRVFWKIKHIRIALDIDSVQEGVGNFP